MNIAPTFESVVTAQRANFLQTLSNASQAAEQKIQRKAVDQSTDTAENLLSLNTGASFAAESVRGRNLDIKV